MSTPEPGDQPPQLGIRHRRENPDRWAEEPDRWCESLFSHPRADTYRRWCLALLVVAWGAQAIVTQSLLLREALVLMFGSEFAWGVVLFAWLFGVAAGALFGGWLAERVGRAELALVVVLLALSAAACVELWVFRGARGWLGVQPGELLPLPTTALAAMLFVSPTSALVGMAFPLACCVGRRIHDTDVADHSSPASRSDVPRRGPYLSFGHIYALESAGSLVGGAAFSFWAVEHLTPIQTALLCGAVSMAASAGLLAIVPAKYTRARSGRVLGSVLAGVALATALVAMFAGGALNRWLVERRWQSVAPGYELVAETESKYQNLAIGSRAGQFTLYCDGHVTTDFPDPYTFVPLAHFWMCEHPSPRRVLVLGGGVEGLLSEILRHPVEHVDYVELDPRQIELVEPYLAEVDRQALADPRVTVHHVDARYYVKTQRNRFDLVIARLPEPTSALCARFYTDEFFAELRRAMTSRAVLCTTAFAAPGELSAASRDYLASIRATLRPHFPYLVISWGNPAQILAATEPGLVSTDPVELARRYEQRAVRTKLFNPALFDHWASDWLDPEKLAQRCADLDQARDVEIGTDLRPSVYMQRLVLWEAATSGVGIGESGSGGARMIERLRSVSLIQLIAALLFVAAITLVASRWRRRGRDGWATGAITLSVASTGFVTMALSIVWLFAFQNLYGYVYQRIGWIIALFMAGLVIGCSLAQRIVRAAVEPGSTRQRPRTSVRTVPRGLKPAALSSLSAPLKESPTDPALWRWLIVVDLLLASLAAAVPLVLPALAALQGGPGVLALVEWCVSILVVSTGLLGGATFAFAGRLQLRSSGRPGAAAGSVVGADHAGACLGALLCGILLVPVFGTAVAALLLAGMKFGSAGLLVVGKRIVG